MFMLLGFGYISLVQWYRRQHKLFPYASAASKAFSSSVDANREQRPSALSAQQLLRSDSPLSNTSTAENRTLSSLVEDEKIVPPSLPTKSPQMNRTPPGNPGAIQVPPLAAQVTQLSHPLAAAQPKPQQPAGTGFDLPGNIGGDPFATTGGGGFADFSSSGSQSQPAAQAPPQSAFPPMSSAVEVTWSLDRSGSTRESSALFSRTFQSRKSMKPPNILIYCGKADSLRQFQSVCDTIKSCLNPDSYTLYHLQHDQVRRSPWQENSLLLILATEHLYEEVEDVFLDYLYSGGNVMSFGRSFETKFLQTKDVSNHSGLSTFSMLEKWENVKCLHGRYTYEEKEGVSRDVTVTVMARDKCHGEPVLICIDSHPQKEKTMGKAVFSQLYLHKDPTEAAVDQDMFEQLKLNNPARIEILQYLLSWLGVDCCQSVKAPLTAASLFTVSQDLKTSFLSSLKNRLKAGCLKSHSVTLEFVESKYAVDDLKVSGSHLPVICVDALPLPHCNFRKQVYWKNLTTAVLGQVVIYADVLPTTMTLFERLQFSIPENVGLVAIAGRQTAGKGRGGNTWLSPEGCAMFSLLVQIPVNSNLGQRMTFLQHIASLAVVYSVTTIAGYEMLDLKIKWPNDIYYSNKMKIGGVLVTCTVMGPTIHAVIGCGFNVTNSNPTICINDVITRYSGQHGTRLPVCSTEQLIARTINQIESLITDFQTFGHEQFCDRYYSAWLHRGSLVKLESEGEQDFTITGLDDYGFLEVQTQNGMTQSVQPDGNTFDMMHNLIRIKSRVQEK